MESRQTPAYNRLLHFGAKAMRYFVWALRLIVFIVVLLFALKNTEPVKVVFYADQSLENVPLIVVMLSTFVLGTLFGLLLMAPSSFKRRRQVSRMRKELDRIQEPVNPSHADKAVAVETVVPLSPL
jgi:putative membrane protein